MARYIIRQSVDIEIQWVFDTDSDDPLADSHGQLNPEKVISVEVLDWDRPWDCEEFDADITFRTVDELRKWREVGVL